MTTPDQPESNLPPNLPPPPANYDQDSYAARSARAARSRQPAARSSQPRSGGIRTVAVIAVLAVAGLLVYKHFSSGQSSSGQSSSGQFPPGNLSSEGDIRSVVEAFAADWNKADVTAIRSLWCSGTALDTTTLSKQIDWYGHIETSVSDIGGSGDEATATVKVTSSNAGGDRDTWHFLREGGSWKPCKTVFLWSRVPPGH